MDTARDNLKLAGQVSYAYLGVFLIMSLFLLASFARCMESNSVCTLECCCAVQIGCESVIFILCLVFSLIAMTRYLIQVRAVIDLDELTKGCMDEYTTIPDVVFENVVVYTAD